jgi:hypothetical protein
LNPPIGLLPELDQAITHLQLAKEQIVLVADKLSAKERCLADLEDGLKDDTTQIENRLWDGQVQPKPGDNRSIGVWREQAR